MDEAKYIADVRVTRGPMKVVKRPKGKERQYRLVRTQCGVMLCYRPKPMEEQTKYMYILPGALKLDGSYAPAPAKPKFIPRGAENETARGFRGTRNGKFCARNERGR